MKKLILTLLSAVVVFGASAQQTVKDFAKCYRYEKANAEITQTPLVVFMGDSITEGWASKHPEFFTDNNFAGRGISGQTSWEMLLRFRADVINLNPKAVVILAGTNDVAQNKGPMTYQQTLDNIISPLHADTSNTLAKTPCESAAIAATINTLFMIPVSFNIARHPPDAVPKAKSKKINPS